MVFRKVVRKRRKRQMIHISLDDKEGMNRIIES